MTYLLIENLVPKNGTLLRCQNKILLFLATKAKLSKRFLEEKRIWPTVWMEITKRHWNQPWLNSGERMQIPQIDSLPNRFDPDYRLRSKVFLDSNSKRQVKAEGADFTKGNLDTAGKNEQSISKKNPNEQSQNLNRQALLDLSLALHKTLWPIHIISVSFVLLSVSSQERVTNFDGKPSTQNFLLRINQSQTSRKQTTWREKRSTH